MMGSGAAIHELGLDWSWQVSKAGPFSSTKTDPLIVHMRFDITDSFHV